MIHSEASSERNTPSHTTLLNNSHIPQDILAVMQQGGYVDFFVHRQLTSHNSDMFGVYSFISGLTCSDWSPDNIHGADMLPGMMEGFQAFLTKQGQQLNTISKIRFNKKTKGDLLYTLLETPSPSLQSESNVYGVFSDTSGKDYFFYAIDTQSGLFQSHKELTLSNPLTERLLLNTQGVEAFRHACQAGQQCIDRRLADLSDLTTIFYRKAMNRTIGYALATIMDMQTLMRQARDQIGGGLVISYKDLQRLPDIDRGMLLDGSCLLKLERIGDIQQTRRGYGTSSRFVLHQGDKELVSGICLVSL